MPAIGNLVVADATPTNQTLYPLSASMASSKFLARTAATAAGNRSAELKFSMAGPQRATDRVTVLYARPYEVSDGGLWVVDSIGRVSIEFVVPASWSATERGHLYAEAKNLVAHATVQAYVKDRDPCY